MIKAALKADDLVSLFYEFVLVRCSSYTCMLIQRQFDSLVATQATYFYVFSYTFRKD